MERAEKIRSLGQSFEQLVKTAVTLRGENGCVWDKEQTTASLKPFLLEESYEVVAAIDEGNPEHVKEELGDLLYQIIFLSQILMEEGEFDIVDVIDHIQAKLIRRHPHVFGNERMGTSREVIARWEEIKREEGKKPRESIFDGIPPQLPGLMRAHRVLEKAGRLGLEREQADQALERVKEEVKAFESACSSKNARDIDHKLGDILLVFVTIARLMHVDPEKALNQAIERFVSKVQAIEKKSREKEKDSKNISS
ncbi:MAG: nucleoside triphosphate pyrophosphohydrolase [bacterium]